MWPVTGRSPGPAGPSWRRCRWCPEPLERVARWSPTRNPNDASGPLTRCSSPRGVRPSERNHMETNMTKTGTLHRIALALAVIALVGACSSGGRPRPRARRPAQPHRAPPPRAQAAPSAAANEDLQGPDGRLHPDRFRERLACRQHRVLQGDGDAARHQPQVLRRPEQAREPGLGVPPVQPGPVGQRDHPGRARRDRL